MILVKCNKFAFQAFGMTDAEHEILSEKVDAAMVINSLII